MDNEPCVVIFWAINYGKRHSFLRETVLVSVLNRAVKLLFLSLFVFNCRKL